MLRVSFEFSDSTLHRLIECVGYMKIQEEGSVSSLEHVKARREGWTKVVITSEQIGQSCSLSMLMQLIEVSDKRVDLDVNSVRWKGLIEAHIRSRESKRENTWTFGTGFRERCLLYHAIQFKQFFLVRALLECGANPNGAAVIFSTLFTPCEIKFSNW